MLSVGKQIKFGFSVVELLVVIVIFGILAAIVTVGYASIQNRSYDTAVQADLLDNVKILSQFYADNSKYPSTATEFNSLNPKVSFLASNYDTSNNAVLMCRDGTNNSIAMVAKSKSGKVFAVTSEDKRAGEVTFNFPTGWATVCPLANPNFATNPGPSGYWLHTLAGGWVSYVKAG